MSSIDNGVTCGRPGVPPPGYRWGRAKGMCAALASSGERVRHLAEIAGVPTAAGRSYDWEAIEADLGVGLPSDYKLMAESFPEGWFRMFAEAWLPASEERLLNARSLNVMDAVREVQEDEDFSYIDFPFPVFPNPGGLLPCGWLRAPGHIFWVTGPGDPDEWPLVLAEEEYEYWERFEGPLCQRSYHPRVTR